ncbi:MAG: YidC/Oxa1 family membrane protein insertase [Oscillospiraceae bacterium]|nr:YidC/Oxa1 family membrane protein insertase [Oscillospiraceae bacterium]
MILAFKLSDLVTVPFGYLLSFLYQLTSNYGIALIIFAVLVKLILYPVTAKGKKESMKMSRLTPRLKVIQERYANDQTKQNEAIQALYKEEGVSMGGGCLWSMIPLFILIPLFTVIRQPIVYMLHENLAVAEQIVAVIKELAPSAFSSNNYYDQVVAAQLIPQYAEAIKAAIPAISEATLEGVNFSFLQINMGAIPQFNVFKWEVYNWSTIGAFLIPLLSAGSQVLNMKISMNMNNSVVTDEKGIQDEETAKKSQANQTNNVMMWTMPLMSLWIGFTVPSALSLYWFVQGIISMVMDVYLTKKLRTIYDAEDALRLQKALEQERIEAEKERIRAERRAANPDGITENTSKKKLQQKQQREADAAKAAAAREYAEKKGIVFEEEESAVMSGIPSRPYCKGRNYDPNRYTTEE